MLSETPPHNERVVSMTLHPELVPLGDPEGPTLAMHGITGSTTYGYAVVAENARGHSVLSEEVTLATGVVTLSGASWISIRPPVVSGATLFSVYRTTGGATQGKIGTTRPGVAFRDNGKVGDDADGPTQDTSGVWAYYSCRNVETGALVSGDIFNHSISISRDGLALAAAEYNMIPGHHQEIGNGEYAIQLSSNEVHNNTVLISGTSATEDVIILPTRVTL